MKAKTQLTNGQRARIMAQQIAWGGSTYAGLQEMYEEIRSDTNSVNAAWLVDHELASRLAWMSAARITPEGQLVIVTEQAIEEKLQQM